MGTKLCLAVPGLRWLLRLWLLFATCEAFYFPGLVPITYCEESHPNSRCQVRSRGRKSPKGTDTGRSHPSFDFCQDSLKKTPSETLGKILSGEEIVSCPYKVILLGGRHIYLLSYLANPFFFFFPKISRLVNSFFVVLALCGLVIIIILKGICRDIAKYSGTKLSFGWRMIHGSVFMPPEHGMLLSVLLGQGTQVFIMTFFSLFLAGLGFLTLADQSALMNYAIVLWLLLEIPAGYVSAKMYKTFNGRNWKMHFMLTSLLFPGIIFTDIFIMNLSLWMEGSSAAVSFVTLTSVFAVCFGISTPLTFLGVYFGKKEEFPVQTQETSPESPQRSFFKKPTITIILSSLLPFGCIFLQLSYILSHIWSPHMYYLFAFLFLSFLIILISCSEVTVLLCYFRLCAEDCGWWWRAFLTSSFTSFYIFVYAIHYFFSKLQVTGIGSTFMYFGYTLILVLVFFLFTGNSCFLPVLFVRLIMSVDGI
uniref:Transmembrane 9 superfamily member n=1 Tax=Peromyscus maniculatus bairdii TaxID=230844 RepID=A0A8C8W5U5_PERMB